jgi:long-chain acyl-CoA synthetase
VALGAAGWARTSLLASSQQDERVNRAEDEGNRMTITNEDIHKIVEGQTVPSEFLKTVAANPDAVALRWQDEDDSTWGERTYAEYAAGVARVAAGYQAQGVKPGDRIVLMMRNVPEFHICDMAAYFCGATPVSIYNSSSPEQVEYLVNHSEAVLAVVENKAFLDRFLPVRDKLTNLKTIVMLKDADQAPEDVVTLEAFNAGVSEPLDLDAAVTNCTPDQLATMIYTSGTTGPPKGVMLTHNNIAWTVESLKQCIQYDDYVGKRLVSYLPMAHIAERMTSHYQGAFVGYEVTCCPDPGLLAGYLKEVHPNFMFGVPRVWEKINAGLSAAMAADPDKKAQFDEGVAAAIPIVEAMDWGTATDEQKATYEFLDSVAFAPIRAALGLDQVEFAITGAAPIPADLLNWYRAIGVPLSEIYGMSESSGPMTWTARRVKAGTVGPAIPGCDVRLAEDGEIICRGGNVFQGYLKESEKTAEALDDEGWLHSGDIGVIDDDGYFKIVDRKKELIITAGGKNVSPANLEAALKMIPLVGQACAIGDQRPFVSALVVLDPEVAPAWAKQHDIEFTSLAELATNETVVSEIERGLEEAMSEFNNAERVKKVKVLGEEWLPDSEVLTPTSKLKRRGIHATYADEIESIYAR